MMDRLVKTLGNETLSLDALRKTDPQQFAKFIHSEHPQTIALILSHLNPSQAAGLLLSLPGEMRANVALRLANLDQISPEITSKIATVIGTKLKALGELSREAYGGMHAVAENVQPPGFEHPQGDPRNHRANQSGVGGNRPAHAVRV
jgi:flagellar motor switch protein FliG